MTYYLLLFIILILMILSSIEKKYSLIFKIITIVTLFIFTVFRYKVGGDWNTYEQLYLTFDPNILYLYQGLFFSYLCYLGNLFDLPFYYVTGIYSFLTLTFIFLAIRDHKYWWFVLLLYMFIPGFFLNSLSIIRQGLAIAILLYLGVKYIRNKSIFIFIMLSIIATIIHTSAVFACILLYIIINYKKFFPEKEYSHYFVLILSLFIGITIDYNPYLLHYITPDLYNHYFLPENDVFGTAGATIPKTIVLFIYVLILVRLNFIGSKRLPDTYFRIVFVGFIFYFILFHFQAVTRISYYFTIFQILLIPYVIEKFKVNQRVLISIIITLFFFAQFTSALIADYNSGLKINNTNSRLIPYRSIFNEIR